MRAPHHTPASLGFAMPAEWSAHAATWMAFPPGVYDNASSLDDARRAWCEVALAISAVEPVSMMVRPGNLAIARSMLGDAVRYVEVELDDAWARDVAPSFVRHADGTVMAIDWRFNGWGAQSWANWENDDMIAGHVAADLHLETYESWLVNEGGGIEVDGEGTLLVTETVQLDPDRNGARRRDEVEDELRAALGVERVVWLKRGLTGDYEEFGTRGHVDLLAKFVAPGVVVFHDQRNEAHPDYPVSQELRLTLETAGLETIGLRAPSRTHVGSRLCDWSYVNCYLANDAIVLGTYDDDADDEAAETFASLLPGRRVIRVDARGLFALGGGVHCITQQQPR